MADELIVFHRNRFSPWAREFYATLATLLIFIVVMISMKPKKESYLFDVIPVRYIFVVFAFILLLWMIYRYLNMPKEVILDNNGFKYGKFYTRWHDIEKVGFTCSSGKDFTDTWVAVTVENGTYIIHTRYYEDPKRLRDFFEQKCIEKNIKFVIEDRGLY